MSQSHFSPVQGGALVILTLALSLATFMQVLDSTIANVAIPTIAGDLGASSSQRDMGHHLVWCSQCNLNSYHRLAGKTFRRSAVIFNLNLTFRPCLLALWHFTQFGNVDYLPRHPRCSCRSNHSSFTKFITE